MASNTDELVRQAQERLRRAESGEDPRAAEALRRVEEADARAEARVAAGRPEIPGGQPPSQPVNPATRVQRDGSIGVDDAIYKELSDEFDRLKAEGRVPANIDKDKWIQEKSLNYTSPPMNTAANEQAVRSGIAMDNAQIANDKDAYDEAKTEAEKAATESAANEGRDSAQPETTPEPTDEEVLENKPAVNAAVKQVSEETGEDDDKVKQAVDAARKGRLKRGTDGYYIAQAILTAARNFTKTQQAAAHNALWSTIEKGTFETPEMEKTAWEIDKGNEASILGEEQARYDAIINNISTAMGLEQMGLTWSDMTPEERVAAINWYNATLGRGTLSAEDSERLTNMKGRIQNLKEGEARQAKAETLSNEAQELANEWQRTENQAQDVRLKYLDDELSADIKSMELSNLQMMFPGNASLHLKASVPGFGSAGADFDIPYATLINAANMAGIGIQEFKNALEAGDMSAWDRVSGALGNIGDRATHSRR